jgi:hypothetical protein
MFSIIWRTRMLGKGRIPEFNCWSHLGAMLFGHWNARKSLRDLAFSLKRQACKFYHLGLTACHVPPWPTGRPAHAFII